MRPGNAAPGESGRRPAELCHNLYLGMMVQALVEVTSLAEKGGTDRAAFLEFLGGTVLASEWVRRRSGDLIERDWTPAFTTGLLRKDFDLGLEAARSLEVPIGQRRDGTVDDAGRAGGGSDPCSR